VLVLATLGARERRRLTRRRKSRARPEPEPSLVETGRATIVAVADPLPGVTAAAAWLARAGEEELTSALSVLSRTLHAFGLASADPYVNIVGLRQALVTRLGYGAGEQVADGLWIDAREVAPRVRRQRRTRALQPQARLAALLGARHRALACEELALRARLDLDSGRDREAALQVLVALDAALAELPGEAAATALKERLDELRAQRDGIAAAAQAALAGPLEEPHREAVAHSLARIEAALRARAVASA